MFDCKNNFKNYYKAENFLFCPLCIIGVDSQSHLLDCYVLKNSILELRQNTDVKYEHIFDEIEYQVPAIKLLKIVTERREVIMSKL